MMIGVRVIRDSVGAMSADKASETQNVMSSCICVSARARAHGGGRVSDTVCRGARLA